jgi:hypothetical protein
MTGPDAGEGDGAGSRPNYLLWSLLFGIGFLVYELTAQPALSVAVVCAKFGWSDLQSALWLRRVDPDRRRGRCLFWLYLAGGLWRLAVAASIAMVLLLLIQACVSHPRAGRMLPNALLEMVSATLLEAFAGFGAATLAVYTALAGARGARLRLWLDVGVHRARRENVWPPAVWRGNRAPRVLMTAFIFTLIALISLLILVPLAIAAHAAPGGGAFLGVCCGAGLPILGGIAVLVVRDLAGSWVAKTPWECYGDPAAWTAEPAEDPA